MSRCKTPDNLKTKIFVLKPKERVCLPLCVGSIPVIRKRPPLSYNFSFLNVYYNTAVFLIRFWNYWTTINLRCYLIQCGYCVLTNKHYSDFDEGCIMETNILCLFPFYYFIWTLCIKCIACCILKMLIATELIKSRYPNILCAQ